MTTTGETQPAPQAERRDPAPPPRRHRVRKWLARFAAVVLALLVLIAIVIQIVLWTGLPKSIVVGQVENGLGLRMAVDSLSTNWLGHTSMGNVKIALPISEQAFFDVPEMKVKHTNLVALLLGWSVEIKAVELHKPVLYVRQSASGQWNIQQVMELLARAGGKKTGEQTAQTSAPALPYIKIDQMTIVVLDNKGRQVRVEPVNVNGEPDTPAWKYDVEIPSGQPNVPPHLSFLGRVAPGGTWAHEATLWVNDVTPWVRPFVPAFDQKIVFHGKWTGELKTDGVSGYLQIVDAAAGPYHADGAIAATQNGSNFAISPRNLHLSAKDLTKPVDQQTSINLTIPGGTLDYNGKVVHATQVRLALLGGPATFNGWFEPDLNQGALEAFWSDMQLPKTGVTQSGKLNLTYSRPVAAPMRIHLSASSSGSAPQGTFDAVVKLDVTGQEFTDLNWALSVPQLAYYRPPQPVILSGLTATGTYHQDADHKAFRLEQISLSAQDRLAGNGSYDLVSKQGQLHVEGQDWPLHLLEGTQVAFLIDATGRGVPSTDEPRKTVPTLSLQQFVLRTGDATLTVKGDYDGRKPKPVDATVSFVNSPGPEARLGRPALIHGYISGTASLAGTISPQQLSINGSLVGREAEVLGHSLGDVTTKLVGSIDDQKAVIRADGIPLLEGNWNLGATYVMKEGQKPVYATTVDLSVDHLPLPRVSKFLDAPNVDGMFAGRWYVYYPGLKPEVNAIRVTGGGNIRGLAASYLIADDASFTTSLQESQFDIKPLRLTRGNYGRADASAHVDLNNWRQVIASLQLTNFPIDVPSAGVGVQLSGGSNQISISMPDAKAKDAAARKLRINAELDVRSVVSIESQPDPNGRRTMQPEGAIRTLLGMNGRVVDLRQISGDLLGGTLSGNGIVDVDQLLTQSRLNVDWHDLQSDRVVRLYPGMKGFGGTYSGSARLAPATGGRPLEPLKLDVTSTASNGHWRTIQVGNAELHAFLGARTQRFTDATATMIHLIASDQQISGVHVGGGLLNIWFSSSGHIDLSPTSKGVDEPSGVTVSNQLNLTLRAIDIDQFVKAFEPGFKGGYGRLAGTVFLLSAPKTRALTALAQSTTQPTTAPAMVSSQETAMQRILATTTMDASVQIANSDLGNFSAISFLYNAMHLGGGPRTPTGHGTVEAHMEMGKLHVKRLYYFNRGIEVRGVATVDQMWNLPDCPLNGSAIGTARPLKNIKLPLFAEADAILSSLQGTLTNVMFDNTLRNPGKFQIVSLAQLGGELRGLLLGELGGQ
jgi:hypothetical protein